MTTQHRPSAGLTPCSCDDCRTAGYVNTTPPTVCLCATPDAAVCPTHYVPAGYTSALHVMPGDVVRVVRQPAPSQLVRRVGSSHYSGSVDGTGTISLEFTDGTSWHGPATTRVELVSRTMDLV